MFRISLVTTLLIFIITSACYAITTQAFYTDFKYGVPDEFSGYTNRERTPDGYGSGTYYLSYFGDWLLRNDTGGRGGPLIKTTLTLESLPEHTSIDLNFGLGIIDDWNGAFPALVDYFNVSIGGDLFFRESFANRNENAGQGYVPPEGVSLMPAVIKQGWGLNGESLYDMGLDPIFDNISHTADTLTISWWADGAAWEGSTRESWAIGNIEVLINTSPIPEPSTIILLGSGLLGLAWYGRKRKKA